MSKKDKLLQKAICLFWMGCRWEKIQKVLDEYEQG